MTWAGRFAGKTAIVSGAAFGIGRATAERLAAEGARLVLIDLAAEIDDFAAKLRAAGAAALAVQGDVAEEDTWQRAADLARAAHGGVDVLVSNAAVNNRGPAHELSRASWDAMLGVNLTATFLGVRACVADLAERQGAVVVTSSVHALIGLPGNPAYAAAKGGLTALTRQLARHRPGCRPKGGAGKDQRELPRHQHPEPVGHREPHARAHHHHARAEHDAPAADAIGIGSAHEIQGRLREDRRCEERADLGVG